MKSTSAISTKRQLEAPKRACRLAVVGRGAIAHVKHWPEKVVVGVPQIVVQIHGRALDGSTRQSRHARVGLCVALEVPAAAVRIRGCVEHDSTCKHSTN